MKVAVLGSFRSNEIARWNLEYEKIFFDTCRHIGWSLAKAGCSLVAPRLSDDTNAEKYACSGFNEARTKGEIIHVSVSSGTRTWASAHVLAAIRSDAVILLGGTEGTYEAGRAAIDLHKIVLPITRFGGAAREMMQYLKPKNVPKAILELSSMMPLVEKEWFNKISETILQELSYPRFLIIHGRCIDRDIVRDIIVNSNIDNVPAPIIMKENALEANTIPNLFEELANTVHAAIAVVTPDDIAFEGRDPNGNLLSSINLQSPQIRARENIWLELGWFWGRLGRDKILILKKKIVHVPTDLGGIYCLEYRDSPKEVSVELEKFILKLRKHEI